MGKQIKIKSTVKYCLELGVRKVLCQDMEDAVRQAEVISFDIFDTLIKRNVEKPEQVHYLVEREFFKQTGIEVPGYTQYRIKAEENARKHSEKEEVSLEEIFYFLTGIPEEWKSMLQELERQLEIKICTPNLNIKPIYAKAVQENKRVIITSDMYLDQETIEQILHKCGYKGYERIYLSSFYGKCKAKGSIYQVIKKDYLDFSGRILHIGDQVEADYRIPKKAGMKAVLIDGQAQQLRYWKRRNEQVSDQFLYQRLYAFLNNRITDNDSDAYVIGWEILGPMLLGFCRWMYAKWETDGIERVFFLSREGKLFQDAFQILYPHCQIKQSYLYGSRQALAVPLLADAADFDEMLETFKLFSHVPMVDIIPTICAFDKKKFCEELKKNTNLNDKTRIDAVSEEEKEVLYSTIMKFGNEYFEKQRENIHAYLRNNNFSGNLAVVDIGWSGTMQRALQKYTAHGETKLHGYYLGVRNIRAEEHYADLSRAGYLFDHTHNRDFDMMARFTAAVLEILCSNMEGSVLRYDAVGERVIPVLAKREYRANESKFIKDVQSAALDFLNEIGKDELLAREAEIPVDLVMDSYARFAVNPSLATLRIFQKFNFMNGEVRKVIPEHSLFYYMFRLRRFNQDFRENSCKIFFLKKLLKIRIPYYRFLRWLLLGWDKEAKDTG